METGKANISNNAFGGGTRLNDHGAEFSLWSRHAQKVELCLFNAKGEETARHALERHGDFHVADVAGIKPGQLYGYRVYGAYEPDNGLWFDPAKLLLDPYATEIDRPFVYDPRLGQYGVDTAELMPRAILRNHAPCPIEEPIFKPGGFIYEICVRGFTIRHEGIAPHMRGTIAALATEPVIAHLKRLGVDTVELMPITAWIDERHLPPLGLSNSWGYNPVGLMALDPRLCPGGMAELRQTVAALRAAGIGTILDLVFNHTGESDRFGPSLSLRGIDNLTYYRHMPGAPGELVNDTGCGNTLAADHAQTRALIVESLRHFVRHAGVDGFRFDLAPILGRTDHGFEAEGETLSAMLADPLLKDRVFIAEPWDIGPGGYQLGQFPQAFLEWNDRARDDMRRFWRGDQHMMGAFASAMAGSSAIFCQNGQSQTRSVNFIAAHDGFTLYDLVSHAHKHNEANGEDNRDGHNENYSWNHGVEGETNDPALIARRRGDVMALLASLFISKGSVMLTAGDEGLRSQKGNNNAYAQDNDLTWLNWAALDETVVAYTAMLSHCRKRFSLLQDQAFYTGNGDITWLNAKGEPMRVDDWESADSALLTMLLTSFDHETQQKAQLAILINRAHERQTICLPKPEDGAEEQQAWQGLSPQTGLIHSPEKYEIAARQIALLTRPL